MPFRIEGPDVADRGGKTKTKAPRRRPRARRRRVVVTPEEYPSRLTSTPTRGASRAGKRLNAEKRVKTRRVPDAADAARRKSEVDRQMAKDKRARLKRERLERARKEREERRKRRERERIPTIKELTEKGQRSSGFTQIAGALPGGEKGPVGRLARDLTDTAYYMPSGIYELGKAAAKDIADLGRGRGAPHRTGEIAKVVGKQYAHDYRHPIRYAKEHPGFVALDVLAALSAGAGTATRANAASRAARAGAGAKGAAKAYLKRPIPAPRTHTYKGEPIRGRYSENAAARGVQKALDKRGKDVSARKAARLLGEERRLVDASQRAPGLRALSAAKGVTSPEDMAIRVVGNGLPLDDVIEAHVRMASKLKPKQRKEFAQRIRLLEGAREYLDVGSDGLPVISAKYPKLREKLDVGETAALTRESRLIENELLDPDTAMERRSAAGRVMLGARFEPKSLADLKGPTFNLIGKRVVSRDGVRGAIVDVSGDIATVRPWSKRKPQFTANLEDLFSTGRSKSGRLVGGGRAVQRERPRTVAEAQARLDELEAKVEGVVDTLAKQEVKGNPDIRLNAELSRRSRKRSNRVAEDVVRRKHGGEIDIQRTGEAWRYVEDDSTTVRQPKTQMELARDKVLDELIERGKKENAHPSIKRFNDALDEMSELRAALAFEKEKGTPFAGLSPEAGSLGSVEETIAFERFNQGRFRVPEARPGRIPKGEASYQGGIPRKPGTLTNPYTGALTRTGRYTTQTLKAIGEDALQAERYLSLERYRQRVLPMGEKLRPADTKFAKYAPVRVKRLTKKEAARARELLRDVELENLTPDEAARIEAALQSTIYDELFPEKQLAGTRVGQEVPGVVWVDRKLLGPTRKLLGPLGYVDVAQDAVKGLILYGKPGYVTPNMLGNAGFNVFQQGFLAPVNWVRQAKLPRDLKFLIDDVMGAGFVRGLSEGTTSRVSLGVRHAADFWSRFVDQPFRRASFIHEARKRGYKTNDEMRALIESGSDEFAEVAQRSRDAIIDFEKLSPVERDIVRRVLFIYPWIKGSTIYAGQFLRDHPIQAAVFANLARQGKEQAQEDIGGVPAWARGSFKVGGSEEQPLIVNPTNIAPFTTPAQVLRTVQGGLGDAARSEQLGEMTSPLLQSGIEAAFGRDLFTGRELEGGALGNFGEQTLQNLPQYRLYERLAKDNTGNTYPYGPLSSIGQFTLGSASPRPANRAKLNEQAQGPVPAPERAARAARQERDLVLPKLKGLDADDRRYIRRAYDIKGEIETLRARVEQETESGEPYYRAILAAEAQLMGKLGVLERDDVDFLVQQAGAADYERVRELRGKLVDGPYERAYLKAIRFARAQAGASG